jgi:putative endonuclease
MSKISEKKVIGNHGEEVTARYLQEQGFSIRAMNYRKPYGEIDIIAQKKDLLIFVEVKTRRKNYFDASLLITPSKQKKIILVAKEYIFAHTLYTMTCRFDASLVTTEHAGHNICYIPNAFMGE